ncbi:Uncharacterised protein [Segatella copri]|nr:Uncharacterised protein [Segatella copri]
MFQGGNEARTGCIHPWKFIDEYNLSLLGVFFFQQGYERIKCFQPVGWNSFDIAAILDERRVEIAKLLLLQFLAL